MTHPLSVVLLVLAMAAQAGLTLYVLIRTGRTRVGHVKARRVKISDIALGQNAWPEDATKLSNNYNNQFQVPVLFFVVALLTVNLGRADMVMAVLAMAFVVSRLVHMRIHTGSNVIRARFNSFVAGVAIVAVMWVWLVLGMLLGF